jgi:hypothetical protein
MDLIIGMIGGMGRVVLALVLEVRVGMLFREDEECLRRDCA